MRALYPSKVNGETLKGAWPAIWMLGSGNGYEWPRHGEIDMMEAVNGRPKIYMATHSTNHNGGNAQHPSAYAYEVNADFTQGTRNRVKHYYQDYYGLELIPWHKCWSLLKLL